MFFFVLTTLIFDDGYELIKSLFIKAGIRLLGMEGSSSYFLNHFIMDVRDCIVPLIVILFKLNEDLIRCFTKIDDRSVS